MVFVEINSLQGIGRSWTGFLLSLIQVGLAIPAAYLLLSVLRLPLFTAWLAIVAANALMAAAGLRWVQGSLRNLEAQPPEWSPSLELPAIGAGTVLEPEPTAAQNPRLTRPAGAYFFCIASQAQSRPSSRSLTSVGLPVTGSQPFRR
jgi:hypothetical protein